LIEELTDEELELLFRKLGFQIWPSINKGQPTRDDYEMIIEEADREDFYREYRKILLDRNKK
jgi:hypothetical protein